MGTVTFLTLLLGTGLYSVEAVTHSMKYFETASSGVPNFPEFVAVGMVDDVEFYRYDSETQRGEPKQDWMEKVTADDPEYWNIQTLISMGHQQIFKANIDRAKQRFNQTGGVHLYQRMYGCEWDEESGKGEGFYQDGYDGEDFISFDFKTESFIAPRPEGLITKHKWDNDKVHLLDEKNYFTNICPDWGKKYVGYGSSSLLRTDLPSVSLLQKTSSSPVTCHATGFYPNRAMMFWRKGGVEHHEDVELGEILPNHDGTFQMSADLKPSASEDWGKYECVFQLSGAEDVITRLDKAVIRSNEGNMLHVYVIVAVAAVALLLIAVIGFVIIRRENQKKNEKRPPSPGSEQSLMEEDSETS